MHGLRTFDVERDRTADHHVGHFGSVGVFCGHVTDKYALAQHGNTVGNRFYLVELVRNDHNGLSVVAHVSQNMEQTLGFLRRKHGRGLVENQNVRTAIENLYDFNRLLLRNGHVVDFLVGVDLKAIEAADVADLLCHSLHIQKLLILQAQNDVFCGSKDIYQLEVLVDHSYAQRKGVVWRTNCHGPVVYIDLSFVGIIDPRKHVHQRCLSAAVFTQQRQNLAAINVQPYSVVCKNGPKSLGDVSHFNGRLCIQSRCTSFRSFRMRKTKGRSRGDSSSSIGLQ